MAGIDMVLVGLGSPIVTVSGCSVTVNVLNIPDNQLVPSRCGT
jgi:hypothetical protein